MVRSIKDFAKNFIFKCDNIGAGKFQSICLLFILRSYFFDESINIFPIY